MQNIEAIWLAIIGGIMAITGWIVRKILTNEKQVAVLEHEINHNSINMKIMKDQLSTQHAEIIIDIAIINSDIKKLLERNNI